MQFHDYEQHGFWGNIDYPSNEEAKKARDAKAKVLRAQGFRVKRWTLPNQLRPYAGLGVPDGRVGNVYYVDAYPPER